MEIPAVQIVPAVYTINVSSSTSTLVLRNLSPYFAGTYKCAVSGTGSPLSLIHHANFTVTVVGEFTI